MPELDAEARVLGGVLSWPSEWPKVSEALSESHFRRDAHVKLWNHLHERQRHGRPWVDMEDVVTGLIQVGTDIESMGGLAYLTSLPERCETVDCIPYLLRHLEVERKRRALRDMGEMVRRDLDGDPDELRAKLEGNLRELASSEREGWTDGQGLADLGFGEITRRRDARARGTVAGWSTGIRGIDKLTGGLAAPQYWVIAARPKMGKSALTLQWAIHLAESGHRVAIFSLELPRQTLATRALCHLSGVGADRMRDGNLDRHDLEDLSTAAEHLYSLPIHVDDRPCSPGLLRSRLAGLVQRVGQVDVVVVDYLQLMQRDQGTRYGSRAEEVGAASHTIQALLKEMGCAGLIVASLNRGVESRQDKRPMPYDLRESGDIESDVDALVMLYREVDNYGVQSKEIELLVRLARHGETGVVTCQWEGSKQSIREGDYR